MLFQDAIDDAVDLINGIHFIKNTVNAHRAITATAPGMVAW